MINDKLVMKNKLIVFIFSLLLILGINIRNVFAAEEWQNFEDLGTTLDELLQTTSPQNINIYIEGKYITDISVTSNKTSGQAGVVSIDINKNESVSRLNVKIEANGGIITKQSDANKVIKSGKTVFNAGFLIDKSDVDYDYDLTFTAYDNSDNLLQKAVFKSNLQTSKEAFKIVDKSNGGKPYTLQQLIENQSLFQTVLKEKIKIKQMLVLDNVSIDFLNSKLLGTTANMEYSFNSTNGLLGTFEACTDTETIVSALVPGKVICIREKGAPNNYRLIEISNEAAAPKFTIDYLNERTIEVIPTTVEYSTSKTFVAAVSGSGAKLDLSTYADIGASIYFRYKATTGAMPSKSFELKVPKRPIKPVITANYQTGTTTQKILATTEYANDDIFTNGYNIGEGKEVALEGNKEYYFRVKATEKNFKGETLELKVNGQVSAGTPFYDIDYINETTNQVIPTTVEYSYDSGFKGGVFTGNGRKLALDPGNTDKTIYFRYKGTSSLFPGDVFSLKIDARPPVTSYSIDYIKKSTKEILKDTDEYAQDIKFTKGRVAGNGSLCANLNPETRDKKLYFRTKATASAFSGIVQELQIPALPSAPTYAIDFINEKIKNVVDEVKIGETGGFFKLAGTDINMADGLGKNIYFKKSAIDDVQFESQIQTIKIPVRPKAPVYTIDYGNATTNQVVPSTVEISESGFAFTNVGQGTKLLLYPDWLPKTLYFRVKATQNNFRGEVSELYVPASGKQGPVFTINYSEERTMQAVTSSIEYSYDKDFITGKSVGEGKTLVLTPGKDIYFRYKAGYNSFPSLTTKLTIPARPRISGNFIVDFENETVRADSYAYVDNRYEYSGDVTFAGTVKNANGGPLPVTPGANIYIRLRATNADFSSEIYEIMVPQRPEVQNFTIDTVNKTTQQIVPDYVSYKVMNGDVVVNVNAQGNNDYDQGKNELLDVSQWNGYTIYFQIPATDSYFKSNEKSVKIEF